MPDLTQEQVLGLLSGSMPPRAATQALEAVLRATRLDGKTAFNEADLGRIAIGLLEMAVVAADVVGSEAFDLALEDDLEASLDAILDRIEK